MRYLCCPAHPGLIIENHPCPGCGHPQALPEGREPYKHLWLVESQEQEGNVQDTATIDSRARVDTYDLETGEITGQLTLPGLPAHGRVPTVYKPFWEMTGREFNTHDWRLEEDDRMAVKVKDGMYQVTVARKGVTE